MFTEILFVTSAKRNVVLVQSYDADPNDNAVLAGDRSLSRSRSVAISEPEGCDGYVVTFSISLSPSHAHVCICFWVCFSLPLVVHFSSLFSSRFVLSTT